MISNNLRIIENKGVKYIDYPFFDDLAFVKAIGSTRYGGVSSGENNSSMNLGFKTIDEEKNVQKNYEIFADAVGLDCDRIVTSSQFPSASAECTSMPRCIPDAGKSNIL